MPKATKKTHGRRGVISPIEDHIALLGKAPDAEIARLSGASKEAVSQFRHRRKIAVFSSSRPGDELPAEKGEPKVGAKAAPATKKSPVSKTATPTRKGRRGPASKLDARLDIVGVLGDGEVAKRVGITRAAVAKYRTRHGIAPGSASTAKATAAKAKPIVTQAKPTPPKAPAPPRRSKLDAFIHQIGIVADAEIARRAGVSRERVRQFKIARGLGGAKSGSNVAVVAPARQTAASVPAPKSGPAGGTAPTRASDTSCWRVSLRDGSATHLAAGSCEEAARKAQAALGETALGVVWLGGLL